MIRCLVWKQVARILSEVAESSPSQILRRKAVTALLELSKDFSLQSLTSTSNAAIEEGCKIFLGCLLETRSHITDVPGAFSSFMPDLKQTLHEWITCLEFDTSTIEDNSVHAVEVQGASMRERGALYIFLPIAFELLASPNEEIKRLGRQMTSCVDIAQLVSSYMELLGGDLKQNAGVRLAKDVDSLNERF